ncbi:hypothetical protein QBC35DRAFT_468887 [Podospora australis]|uniref:Uncharacterized protein n=1 Tax=Podospora australis TaxID=1536484 RepID=A0AAN7ANH0_9PEZI|nr:hypothetical protein QBC35DRAFT_468887 [Podospora australis]
MPSSSKRNTHSVRGNGSGSAKRLEKVTATSNRSLERGAPHLKTEVIPVWWGHHCLFRGGQIALNEWEEPRYIDIEKRPVGFGCPMGCGYITEGSTVLYNCNRVAIETIHGVNFLPDRYTPSYMLCCQCWRWEANCLEESIVAGGSVPAQKIGVNSCRHCYCKKGKSMREDHRCERCSSFNVYGEIVGFMGGKKVPSNSVILRQIMG